MSQYSPSSGRPSPDEDLTRDPKVLLIVPAFNEEESLPDLIREIRGAVPKWDYLVIDDGSTDATMAVARRAGARVISLPFNLGIGGAVQCGIRFAYEHGYDICIQCDGDGQHDPAQVKLLVSEILSSRSDMAIGSRFIEMSGFQSTPIRRAGIRVLGRWIYLLSGKRILDPTSGFRAMNRRLICEFREYYPQEYPEPESLFYLLHRGYSVREVPVEMRRRRLGESSIRRLRSILYMMKVCTAIAVDSLRDRRRIQGRSR